MPDESTPSRPPFVWGVGIESSTLPHLGVDQFAWTQHDKFWRDDLKRVRETLGVRHLRYAVPWDQCEPKRGTFDWAVADERIGFCRELGIELLMDVMHFGTPAWLPQAVGDPEFPEALEAFTAEIVGRYRHQITTWCPVNEPLVTALFSGDFGFWPPHARKWRGYMPVLARVALGTSRAIRAIRRTAPEAVVLLCDAADHFKTRDDTLRGEVQLRNLRRFAVMDLILGRVDRRHALYPWLTSYGLSELDLEWFRTHPQSPDVLGLDYYPHSDWQIDRGPDGAARQKRADSPVGLYGVAGEYYARYGLPMMVTETSIEGRPINREVWLEKLVADVRRLRGEGVPLTGLIWWPAFDHLDWDGAMTHRVGKLHEVGLFKLTRQADGVLKRTKTPLADLYAEHAASADEKVGPLEFVATPVETADDQLPPLAESAWADPQPDTADPLAARNEKSPTDAFFGPSADAKTNGHALPSRAANHAPRTADYGILVFSHLRWGFVWQRPQQFLSRFAKRRPVLFIEEPWFDVHEGGAARLELHQVMPNVTVACPHCPPSWAADPAMPRRLREWAREAIGQVNESGAFDRPLLWYYSPMDAAWSLGHFEGRGVVYDCMDELSAFTGAPKTLVANEARLMEHADVVFTGGFNLYTKKAEQHPNVHFFGCGVEYRHFAAAGDPDTAVPPDIDFAPRPILGWFGVVDERVDYALVGEMARMKPEWSFCMVGPVVKVDPALLPHSPNLFWLGGRDYGVLPNYCKAFDVNMMCFAINAATEYINPTKALEYLATGKPVVSTPVKDVVKQYSDLVDLAATPEAFVAAAERALHHRDQARIDRGIERAKASSWESIVGQMQDLIDAGIAARAASDAAAVEPLTEDELAYQYAATQGS